MTEFKITKLQGRNNLFFLVSVGGLAVARLIENNIKLLAGQVQYVKDFSALPCAQYKNKYDADDIVREVSYMHAGGIIIRGYNVRSSNVEENEWLEPHLTYTQNGEFVCTVTLSMVAALVKELGDD